MANSTNCSLMECVTSNTNNMEVGVTDIERQMVMETNHLEQFAFNDVFNVVAYSVMSLGK